MGTSQSIPVGPDLGLGIVGRDLADGSMLVGHVGAETVLIARRGDEFFAIGANCSHYAGPLVEGLMVEDTVRCPWHHACFSLRTGEALHAPALSPVDCWSVEQRDGKTYVREKKSASDAQKSRAPLANSPDRIVIMAGEPRALQQRRGCGMNDSKTAS